MTKIEWVKNPDGTQGKTWNPVTGCTKISEGCAHCYAERMAQRLAGRYGYPEAPHHFDVTLHEDKLSEPLRWRRPQTVFVCSMSDLFHENVPEDYLWKVFSTMARAMRHTFLVLTKRPARALGFIMEYYADQRAGTGSDEPLANVWIGNTVENQRRANERISILSQIPAAIRFVSVEPMLEEVNLTHWMTTPGQSWAREVEIAWGDIAELDWVICGAETGPDARPMELDWARYLRDQCLAAGVPFFFKKDSNKSRLLDGREWNEIPRREANDGREK